MFTGIIQSIGEISNIIKSNQDLKIFINSKNLDLSDVNLGDSIAINGVCLTVISLKENIFKVEVSNETIRKTSLKDINKGTKVNLEKALRLSDRLGGHLVSGHVDGTGIILSKKNDGSSIVFCIETSKELAKYIAEKGSVTIDGVSLTVNSVDNTKFFLNIIPHTLKQTIIQNYQEKSIVNIEVDLIARYLERLINAEKSNIINKDFLKKNGYI